MALLKEGQLQALDITHLIEEIETMGRSEKRGLQSRLMVLLVHLLKWQFQPYMIGVRYRISGDLINTDKVMNNAFWIGVQPALTTEMLEFATSKIQAHLGVKV